MDNTIRSEEVQGGGNQGLDGDCVGWGQEFCQRSFLLQEIDRRRPGTMRKGKNGRTGRAAAGPEMEDYTTAAEDGPREKFGGKRER